MRKLIDALADRLGYTRLETAAEWVEKARQDGYVQAQKRYKDEIHRSYRSEREAYTLARRAKDAQRVAERQRDHLQRDLNRANARLEAAGMISVTTFL